MGRPQWGSSQRPSTRFVTSSPNGNRQCAVTVRVDWTPRDSSNSLIGTAVCNEVYANLAVIEERRFWQIIRIDAYAKASITLVKELAGSLCCYKKCNIHKKQRQTKTMFIMVQGKGNSATEGEVARIMMKVIRTTAAITQRDTASAGKRRASASTATQPVWLAVEEDSINILEGENLRLMCRYKYKHVVTFGGCKDDFMLVVNQSIMRGGNTVEQGTQRLLFSMPRGKILEITLLMASYVNAIVRQQGITCDVPPNKKHSNGPPLEPKVWDLESAEWPIIPGSNVTRLV
ncbi:predicted protein [Nematostella vectensis]|uniref:Uncharacterized protein n=1 Tax=Nematostella vectensis TaxID=45351 RepID=A7T3D2_NEMVE|nr:predicted protein [Nematostella vectensis]|eukprot:XP_001621634.1 hypothetical protein NEMVEDRAFT_v1g221763 [Nematostella vectensis]